MKLVLLECYRHEAQPITSLIALWRLLPFLKSCVRFSGGCWGFWREKRATAMSCGPYRKSNATAMRPQVYSIKLHWRDEFRTLTAGVCLMFSTLRAPPAHGAQLVSSCSTQAGTAFLMPAADTELAASTETHGGKVQSRVGKKKKAFYQPSKKRTS